MKNKIKYIVVFLLVLSIALPYIWYYWGKEYYHNNKLLNAKDYTNYDENVQIYRKVCHSWKYNRLHLSSLESKIKKLEEEYQKLKLEYDASKKEKRYSSKVKESIKLLKLQKKFLEKIYTFQDTYKGNLPKTKDAKNKDLKNLLSTIERCFLGEMYNYLLPKLDKKRDKLEMLTMMFIDYPLSKLDIQKAKIGYELVLDYMFKNYDYYLEDIQKEIEIYNDFLYAFGFDRIKYLQKLKWLFDTKNLDNKAKYWQKIYFDDIERLLSVKYKVGKYYYSTYDEKIHHFQGLLYHSYLKKYPVKKLNFILPKDVEEIAKDFLWASVFIKSYNDSYYLGFKDKELVILAHMYQDTHIKTDYYYIKDGTMYKFKMSFKGVSYEAF